MKVSKGGKSLGIIGFFCLVKLSSGAEIEDFKEQTSWLEPTVVTLEEPKQLALNDLNEVIIEQDKPSDLKQLFKRSPGVNVSGGRAVAQTIYVNGLSQNLQNVSIDGASQGSIFHHQSATLIDPNILKSVSVHPGAGSALNGPGALAGSIKFETKNVFDFLPWSEDGQDQDRFGAVTGASYYDNGQGYSLNQTVFGKFSSHWGMLVNAGVTDREDYRDGNGDVVQYTDFDRSSGLIKFSGRLPDGHKIDLGLDLYRANSYTTRNPNLNETQAGFLPQFRILGDLSQERRSFTLNYDFAPDNNELINLELNAFSTMQEAGYIIRKPDSHFLNGTPVETSLEIHGLDLRNTFEWKNIKSIIGFDYQVKNSLGEFHGGEDEDICGIYNQNEIELHQKATLSFGFRHDDYDYEMLDLFATKHSFQSSRTSPNASIIITPFDDLTVDAGYAEAYRGVGIREAYLGYIAAGLPAGRPGEIANTWRASFRYDDGQYFSSGAVYTQEIKNHLTARAPYTYDIQTQGYNLSLGARIDAFRISAAVSHTKHPGSEDLENWQIPGYVVAGRRWLIDLNYGEPDFGVSGGLLFEYREGVDGVISSDNHNEWAVAQKDPYFLTSLYLAWQVEQVEGLRLQINVDNLFDAFYFDHLSAGDQAVDGSEYYANPAPGRQVSLSAKYSF